MSLGFSVGEFFKLGKQVWKLYQACFNAPEVFKSAADQCFGIHAAIEQTERVLYKLNSNYDHDHQDRDVYVKLSIMTSNFRRTLSRLERMLKKYKGLGTSGHNFRDTTRFALRGTKEDLAQIQSELVSHMAAISLFLQSIDCQRLEATVPGSSERTQSRPHVAHIEVDEAQYSQLPGFPASLENALQAKKRKLLHNHPLDQEWRGKIRLLTAAEQSSCPALNPDTPYSHQEQSLSVLPEGWQRVWLNAVEYQYRYIFRPRSHISSRAYNALVPFETFVEVDLDDLLPGWEEKKNEHGLKHYFQPSTGKAQLTKPSLMLQDLSNNHFIGWQCHDGLPLDMDDRISKELAYARYLDERIPADDIDASLPKGWRWSCDGDGHPIYTSSDPGQGPGEWQSTVHPAFFSPHERLPPGWDRRLDNWGLLFYVDYHTATAQRIHPKDEDTIDSATGLPKGWTKMVDQNGVTYYLEKKSLVATYKGSAMRSRDDKHLFTLSSNPKNGEVPRPPEIENSPVGGREGQPEH